MSLTDIGHPTGTILFIPENSCPVVCKHEGEYSLIQVHTSTQEGVLLLLEAHRSLKLSFTRKLVCPSADL